jgi:hypothetical protein
MASGDGLAHGKRWKGGGGWRPAAGGGGARGMSAPPFLHLSATSLRRHQSWIVHAAGRGIVWLRRGHTRAGCVCGAAGAARPTRCGATLAGRMTHGQSLASNDDLFII